MFSWWVIDAYTYTSYLNLSTFSRCLQLDEESNNNHKLTQLLFLTDNQKTEIPMQKTVGTPL